MMIKVAAVLILSILANIPCGDGALMEAVIEIDSDDFRMSTFLQRFKRFIARSHGQTSLHSATALSRYIHRNDTFQANYDFSRNLLTMASSYSLILNGTDEKVSDVKITINFRFNDESNGKIILEDMHGANAIPRIGHEINGYYENEVYDGDYPEYIHQTSHSTSLLSSYLSPIINIVEPVIVAFIHIIINGVLSSVLATAFDHLYNGRLITT